MSGNLAPAQGGRAAPPDYRGRFAEFEGLLMALGHFSALWLPDTGGKWHSSGKSPLKLA